MDKSVLRQYRHLLKEIEELEREKRRVLDRYLTSPQPTGVPGAQGETDRIGEVVAKRDKYQQLIEAKLDQLIALRSEIEEAIAFLPSGDRRLIRLRYFEGLSWERVAEDLHYSCRQVLRQHGRILQSLKRRH